MEGGDGKDGKDGWDRDGIEWVGECGAGVNQFGFLRMYRY